jgi:oligoendopeptidase F
MNSQHYFFFNFYCLVFNYAIAFLLRNKIDIYYKTKKKKKKLPSDFSTNFFSEISNGDGWSLVFYFKITEVI